MIIEVLAGVQATPLPNDAPVPESVQEVAINRERYKFAELQQQHIIGQTFILTNLNPAMFAPEKRFSTIDFGTRKALVNPPRRSF